MKESDMTREEIMEQFYNFSCDLKFYQDKLKDHEAFEAINQHIETLLEYVCGIIESDEEYEKIKNSLDVLLEIHERQRAVAYIACKDLLFPYFIELFVENWCTFSFNGGNGFDTRKYILDKFNNETDIICIDSSYDKTIFMNYGVDKKNIFYGEEFFNLTLNKSKYIKNIWIAGYFLYSEYRDYVNDFIKKNYSNIDISNFNTICLG